MNISETAKNVLLTNSIETIKANLLDRQPKLMKCVDSYLLEKHGAFLAIYVDGKLRGIQGTYKPKENLFNMILNLANDFCDARKYDIKLVPHELPYIKIEIAILSELKQIYTEVDITLGKHGIVVKHIEGEALVLPHEAETLGKGRAIFLNEACHKAGLESYKWEDDDCSVYSFETVSFEKEFTN